MTLWEVAAELSRRLTRIFLRDADGRRPVFGGDRDVPDAIRTGATSSSFHEYFHGDTGAGVGASHQTGWTALVAKLLAQLGELGEAHPKASRLEPREAQPQPSRFEPGEAQPQASRTDKITKIVGKRPEGRS